MRFWLSLKFSFILFISGCALGPDFIPPEIVTPQSYREDVDESKDIVNLAWWKLYEEPALQTLIIKALENNQDLAIAAARIEEAGAILGFTRADLYPGLSISGSLFRKDLEGQSGAESLSEGYTLSTPLSWELDFWGKLRRANEAARAELFATEQFYRAATIALVAEVARAYFLVLDLDNRLEISKRTLEGREKSRKIIKLRFDKGYVSKLDLYQAEVERESAEASVQLYTRELRRAENALSVLLGGMPSSIARGKKISEQSAFLEIPAGIPAMLLERRPDIIGARALLHAQTARIGIAQAQRLPSISLTGAFGVESDDLSEFRFTQDRFWSIGGDLFGPLINYNKSSSRVDIEKARTRQLALDYEARVLRAFREVEDSLVSVRTFKAEYEARKRQVEAGRGAAKLSRARYDAGEANFLEVLDTERSLFRDELAASEALQNKFNSIITLYKALGGGWQIEPVDNPVTGQAS